MKTLQKFIVAGTAILAVAATTVFAACNGLFLITTGPSTSCSSNGDCSSYNTYSPTCDKCDGGPYKFLTSDCQEMIPYDVTINLTYGGSCVGGSCQGGRVVYTDHETCWVTEDDCN